MAPKKKVLRQYGSHKRLTPAERLFNLQYRMQTKGGKHTTGDVPSDEFRAVHARYPDLTKFWSSTQPLTIFYVVYQSNNEQLHLFRHHIPKTAFLYRVQLTALSMRCF